jgi:hypothetical protein
MGSVIPLIFTAPVLALGTREAVEQGFTLTLLGYVALVMVVGWVTTSLFGQVGSGGVKRWMAHKLQDERPADPNPKWFIGFATPDYRSMLDPHEDLGWLVLAEDEIDLIGTQLRLQIPRGALTQVTRKANPHTALGLGGWIAIDWEENGVVSQIFLEPRARPTVLGNKLMIKRLIVELETWRDSMPKRQKS